MLPSHTPRQPGGLSVCSIGRERRARPTISRVWVEATNARPAVVACDDPGALAWLRRKQCLTGIGRTSNDPFTSSRTAHDEVRADTECNRRYAAGRSDVYGSCAGANRYPSAGTDRGRDQASRHARLWCRYRHTRICLPGQFRRLERVRRRVLPRDSCRGARRCGQSALCADHHARTLHYSASR